MNRLFAFLIVAVICVAGIGFYRGWFVVSRQSPDAESNKVNINMSVDPDKVKADAEAAKDKAVDLTGRATEEARMSFTGSAAGETKTYVTQFWWPSPAFSRASGLVCRMP